MKTIRLHLIRHGLTKANEEGFYAGGGSDIPLSEQGIKQLEKLKKEFTYPALPVVFCSPMQRAIQTVNILFPVAQDKIVVEELRENMFGIFEGQNADDLVKDEQFLQWLNPQSGFVPAGGESPQVFSERVVKAMGSMLEYMFRNNIEQAACVTHAGVISSILAQMGTPQKQPSEWVTDPGCGYTVRTSAAMFMRDGLVEVINIVPEGYLESLGYTQ